MQQKNFLSRPHSLKGEFRLFKDKRVLICSALFIALSIILGKYLSFTLGAFRISFENLSILMAGIFFGPVAGLVVGVGADIIGCILVGYTINPFITLGAAVIGLSAGIFSHYVNIKNFTLKLAVSVGAAHILGSMIIKSIGLNIYYGYTLGVLLLRVPLYIVIGFLEFYIIYILLKNKSFSKELERMCNR